MAIPKKGLYPILKELIALKTKVLLSVVILVLALSITAFATDGWWNFDTEDEEDGKNYYAISPEAYPSQVIPEGYGSLEMWVGVGCNVYEEWIFLGFTEKPDLRGLRIGKDGIDDGHIRIVFDGKVERFPILQEWGSRFLHFENDDTIIRRIQDSDFMIIELDWYGLGYIYYEIDLTGADEAITLMRLQMHQM